MREKDALNILKIDVKDVTLDHVKDQYKKLIFEFHPDRNPAGLELSQIINEAYSFLKGLVFPLLNFTEQGKAFFADDLSEALNKIISLADLDIEVCGCWVWVTGNTREHRAILKESGYKYASKKQSWYFAPATERKKWRKGQWSMDKIRNNYGSERVQPESRRAVTA